MESLHRIKHLVVADSWVWTTQEGEHNRWKRLALAYWRDMKLQKLLIPQTATTSQHTPPIWRGSLPSSNSLPTHWLVNPLPFYKHSSTLTSKTSTPGWHLVFLLRQTLLRRRRKASGSTLKMYNCHKPLVGRSLEWVSLNHLGYTLLKSQLTQIHRTSRGIYRASIRMHRWGRLWSETTRTRSKQRKSKKNLTRSLDEVRILTCSWLNLCLLKTNENQWHTSIRTASTVRNNWQSRRRRKRYTTSFRSSSLIPSPTRCTRSTIVHSQPLVQKSNADKKRWQQLIIKWRIKDDCRKALPWQCLNLHLITESWT